MSSFKVFSGSAHPILAAEICANMDYSLGQVTRSRFSDGEIGIQISESVRGQDVFIVQPTCPPANDNLMEILLMIDALKRSSANSIIAVMPYFGYSRQDRKAAPRVPITAKLVANLLETAGIDRLVTLDLHAGQIQGFFDVPVDNLYASVIFADHLRSRNLSNAVVASPDVGGVARARSFAKRLDLDIVIVDKRREKANVAEVMNIIGEVDGKDVIMIDDIVDTAGTLIGAAKALKERGASSVMACCSHPVLSGLAYEKLEAGMLDELIVTNTIPLKRPSDKITVLSVASLFAEVMRRIVNNESVNGLFE
ncbi:MAG: ribose-phosphate pyrophosphokinase [Helicobacteraceae bacterium]|jgi:ribose-phosphate pyrophosphokinase|nr:ribose-phosphate pyrophosphokinase [Helicobacteraceae bacterium]